MAWYPIEIRHALTEDAEQQAYNAIYAERSLHQSDSLYLWFLEQVRRYAPPPARLLDVSCGEGDFLHFAGRAGYDVTGIDFSLTALQRIQERSGMHLPAVVANAQGLPFAGASFDVVTNIGSLEHYFDPSEGVREMARVLRPAGVALVWLPNAFGLFGNILHVLQHGEVFDDGQPLQRYATRSSWQQLLAHNGLRTRRVLGFDRASPRTPRDLYWMLQHPQAFVRATFGSFIPQNLANMLIFVCERDLG